MLMLGSVSRFAGEFNGFLRALRAKFLVLPFVSFVMVRGRILPSSFPCAPVRGLLPFVVIYDKCHLLSGKMRGRAV